MALTYEQSANLINDVTFRGRVKISILKYSTYIQNELATVPGHAPRYRWAQQAMREPEIWTNQVVPSVVMDDTIQNAGGAAATDAQVQSAVEIVVNKFM